MDDSRAVVKMAEHRVDQHRHRQEGVRSLIIALDAGGTMTDAIVTDDQGRYSLGKALTNRDDESVSYLEAVEEACRGMGLDTEEAHSLAVADIYTGTLMLNTLLSRTGKKVGLLITRGNEQMPLMERGLTWLGQSREELLQQRLHEHTPPLVDLQNVRGVTERVASGTYFGIMPPGTVIIPLQDDEVRKAVSQLLDNGVEVIGILFLYSYLNPAHEQRAAEIAREVVKERGRNVRVVTSSELIPVIKENQRLKSLLIECYAAEVGREGLVRVEAAAQKIGYRYGLKTLTAYGTVVPVSYPRLYETVISGPIGGLIGARSAGEHLGTDNLICCDVGGTSTDVGICVKGSLSLRREPDFAGHRLALPMVALDSIGAGTGMAVRVDRQFKRVYRGPDSAGYRVGICHTYHETTVSDIDLALGYLNPDYFLGGKVRLDRQRAIAALEERVARPLGQELYEACEGILELFHIDIREFVTSMLMARGLHPSDFTLCMYGGGGPLHLHGVRGIPFARTLTFPWAAAFSAFGAAVADYACRFHEGVSIHLPAATDDGMKRGIGEQFNDIFAKLEEKACQEAGKEGVPRERVSFKHGIFARYMGHLEAIDVELPQDRFRTPQDIEGAMQIWEDKYAAIYGEGTRFSAAGYYISELFIEAIVPKPKPVLEKFPLESPEPPADAYKGQREAYYRGIWRAFALWEMGRLRAGNRVDGPAIIEDPVTTLVVPPENYIALDQYRIITLKVGSPDRYD